MLRMPPVRCAVPDARPLAVLFLMLNLILVTQGAVALTSGTMRSLHGLRLIRYVGGALSLHGLSQLQQLRLDSLQTVTGTAQHDSPLGVCLRSASLLAIPWPLSCDRPCWCMPHALSAFVQV